MFDKEQFKNALILPTLKDMGLSSTAAVNLLLGTAAQESQLGRYIHQINGPALGIFQMEPRTYDDIFENYLRYHPLLQNDLFYQCGYSQKPSAIRLMTDLKLAIIMARIHYLRVKEPLPHENDIQALAHYWKKYYNSPTGKGTVEQFIKTYENLVGQDEI